MSWLDQIETGDLGGLVAKAGPVTSPQVNTGPSGPSWWGSIGSILTGYARGRANLDLENRADDIGMPDRVDQSAAQIAAGVVGNLSTRDYLLLGAAGVLGVVLIVRLVK